MKMNVLLNNAMNLLEREYIQRQYVYEVVFYIKGKYYIIKDAKLNRENYEWNLSLQEIYYGSQEYRKIGESIRLNNLIGIHKSYNEKFPNLLHKRVTFTHKINGYIYPINMGNMKITSVNVRESFSQIIFYFE